MKQLLAFMTAVVLLLVLPSCARDSGPPLESEPLELDQGDVVTQAKEGYLFKGNTATAYFEHHDDCGWSSSSVFVSAGHEREGRGSRTPVSRAYVYVEQHDWCTGSSLDGFGVATIPPSGFTVDGGLSAARLSVAVDLFDSWDHGFVGRADVRVQWRGSGRTQRIREMFRHDEPGYKYRYRAQGSTRDAVAVGSIALEGIDLLRGLQGDGRIMRVQSGVMILVQEQRLPPQIRTFEAEPKVISEGQSATLTWDVSSKRPVTVRIDEGVGDVTGTEAVTVSPSTTTTYTMTAMSRTGTSYAWATVWVVSPDANEPNNEPNQATPIALRFFDAELSITPGDVDWFVFTLTQETEVVAIADSWGLFDLHLGLFDEQLDLLATSDWELRSSLPAGRYFVAITTQEDPEFRGLHAGAGDYDLSITSHVPPPPLEPDVLEPNDEPADAATIVLDYVSGELTITRGDVDWFTFTLPEARLVAIDVDATAIGSFLDPVVGVFTHDLVEVAVNDDHDGLDSYLEVALDAGTYVFAVSGFPDHTSGFQGDHRHQGHYVIRVTSSAVP